MDPIDPVKYTKSPAVRNQLYVEEELRKIELSINRLIAFAQEGIDMATTEFGTWVPVIVGLTTAGVGTYTLQYGNYYKNGRLIIVEFRVTTSAHTGTGLARILGLPYKPLLGSPTPFHFTGSMYSGVNAANLLLLSQSGGIPIIDLYTGNPSTSVAMAAAVDFIGTAMYITEN